MHSHNSALQHSIQQPFTTGMGHGQHQLTILTLSHQHHRDTISNHNRQRPTVRTICRIRYGRLLQQVLCVCIAKSVG